MMLPDDFKIGKPTVHSKCHVHEYAADLTSEMECTLYQEGEPKGFLDVTKAAQIKVELCLKGGLRHHLCGDICACLHVECLGAGPEVEWECITKEIDEDVACKDGCLEFEFNIEPYTFDPGKCGKVCCFIVTASSIDRCGNPGHIGCWCKLCVMLHEAPKE